MKVKTADRVCGKCGAKISSDSPQNLCVAWLLAVGLGMPRRGCKRGPTADLSQKRCSLLGRRNVVNLRRLRIVGGNRTRRSRCCLSRPPKESQSHRHTQGDRLGPLDHHRPPTPLSYGQLKLLPHWDALRGDPRFEEIVASLAPQKQ